MLMMVAQRPLRLNLELILTVADLLRPLDLSNLILKIPQICYKVFAIDA